MARVSSGEETGRFSWARSWAAWLASWVGVRGVQLGVDG